jgi:transcriptional regulator with XRE-family HTH domain
VKIGEKIRKERKLAQLTIETLAQKIGVSKMTVQRIETGKTSPSIAVLGDIAQTLRKPITTLINESESSGYIKIVRMKEQFVLAGDKLTSRILCPRGSLSIPESESMAVYYVEVKEGTELEGHRNKGYEWVFQLSGTTEFSYHKKKYICNEGDVFFYDGTRVHSARYLGDNKFFLISFK